MAGRQPKRLRAELFLARGSRLGSETETATETELETSTGSELGSESLSGAGTATGNGADEGAGTGDWSGKVGGLSQSLCVSWVSQPAWEDIAVESEKGSSAFLVS